MFWSIVAHEIRVKLLSFRFILVFLATTVLLVTSLLVMSLNYQRKLEDYAEAQIHTERVLEEMGGSISGSLTFEKRPNPLSIFAMGLEDPMTRSMFWHSDMWAGQGKYTNPFFKLFLKTDSVFVVMFIMSFLAMIVSYDAISGERETGTLRLMFSNQLPRDTVLLGKWAACVLMLSWPFLLNMILAILIIQTMGLFPLFSEEILALLGIFLLSLIYVSIYITLGMLISTFIGRSSTSLIFSLLIWVVSVLAILGLSPRIAQFFVNIPSPGQMNTEIAAKRREYNEAINALYRKYVNLPRTEKDKEIVENFSFSPELNKEFAKLIEESHKDCQRIVDKRRGKIYQRDDLSMSLSRISPASAYLFACMGLAGTGIEDFWDLRSYWRQFRTEFMERNERKITDQEESYNVEFPSFEYKGRGIANRFQGILTDLISMVLLNALCFVAMFAKFLRSDLT